VYSSPAADGDEVYFGSDDGKLYKVDIDSGIPIWEFATGGKIRSSPALAGGKVFAASWDGFLYAIDAATGHRICNDCMKSCIYQKQDPVNIPQIETGVLTDVLHLPWGVEIYGLLTRWNPLNISRPHALPYNGMNILIVGLGPAGYTLAHYFLNEGFGVVAIDGLKIEPLPAELAGDGIDGFADAVAEA